MCGIVSYMSQSTTVNKNHEDLLKELLTVDTLRGFDSTGIMYEDKENIYVCKKPMPGFDFVQLRDVKRIIQNAHKSRFIIGHNRAATVGGVSQATAHPFMFENVTGVHNGTLHGNYRNLVKSHQSVDSEYIFAALDEAKNAKSVIPQLQGSFMLCWYDIRDDKIHMIRNAQRPYSLGVVKGNRTIFGASEAGMLDWLGERNNVQFEQIYELTPDQEYVFDLSALDKPHIIKHKTYVAPPAKTYQHPNYNGGNYQGKKPDPAKNRSTGAGRNTNKSETKTGGVPLRDAAGDKLEQVEFVINKFIPNTCNTNPDVTYGRFFGHTLGEEPVVVYNCLDGEFQLGSWYEGMLNRKSQVDGVFSIRRDSAKKLIAGEHGEVFNCSVCDNMKYLKEVIFIDESPVCFPCAQGKNHDIDKVSLTPPKKQEQTDAA